MISALSGWRHLHLSPPPPSLSHAGNLAWKATTKAPSFWHGAMGRRTHCGGYTSLQRCFSHLLDIRYHSSIFVSSLANLGEYRCISLVARWSY